MGRLTSFYSKRFLLGLSIVLTFFSCKHDAPDPVDPVQSKPLLLDSVSMLFQDVFLWNDRIDKTIVPPYEENVDRLEPKLRTYIDAVSLSALNPQTSLPYEFDVRNPGGAKYSTFVLRRGGPISTADFGFAITAVPTLNEYRVLYVKQGSSASSVGMSRSDKIVRMNGKENRVIEILRGGQIGVCREYFYLVAMSVIFL